MTTPPIVTRAAADIGGTFTDVAVLTPDGPARHPQAPFHPEQLRRCGHLPAYAACSKSWNPRSMRWKSCCTAARSRPTRSSKARARRPRCSPPGASATCWSCGGCGCRTSTSRSTNARRRSCRGSSDSRSTSAPGRAARRSAPSTKRTCAPRPNASAPPASRRSRSATCTPMPTPPTSSAPARFSARCFPAPSSRCRWRCFPRSWSTSARPPPSSTRTSVRRSSTTCSPWSPRSRVPASAAG